MGLGEVLEDKQGKKVERKRGGWAGSMGGELIRIRQLEGTTEQPRNPISL